MTRTERLADVGLLILRIGAGGYLATHGWGKVGMVFEGKGLGMDPIGLGETTSLVLVAFAEFVCSLLVLAGLFTRLAALPVVFAMGVAAFVAHANAPWTMQPNGGSKEPALMFLTCFLALAFTGAGRFSLDHVLRQRRARRGDA